MSKVKYRVREYNPTSAQQGSHSFFAEAVIVHFLSCRKCGREYEIIDPVKEERENQFKEYWENETR